MKKNGNCSSLVSQESWTRMFVVHRSTIYIIHISSKLEITLTPSRVEGRVKFWCFSQQNATHKCKIQKQKLQLLIATWMSLKDICNKGGRTKLFLFILEVRTGRLCWAWAGHLGGSSIGGREGLLCNRLLSWAIGSFCFSLSGLYFMLFLDLRYSVTWVIIIL